MQTGPRDFGRRAFEQAILKAMFVQHQSGVRFSKTELAKHPSLIQKAAREACLALDPSVTGICVLATSGVPFGIALAQMAVRPLYFYRKAGWHVPDGPRRHHKILPAVPAGSCLSLVDSHRRTGNTVSGCLAALRRSAPGATVKNLITLVGLDHIRRKSPFPTAEVATVAISAHQEFLSELFGCLREELYSRHLPLASDVWRGCEDRLSRNSECAWVRASPTGTTAPAAEPPSAVLDADLAVKLQRILLPSVDMNTWRLWAKPAVLAEIGAVASRSLDWSRYDAVAGVCIAGSILGHVLAYHAGFPGPVFSCYERPGIVPPPDALLNGKRVLIVQGPLVTAQDTEQVVGRVQSSGGHCEDVVALWWAPRREGVKGQGSLDRLADKGLRFLALSGQKLPGSTPRPQPV